MKKLRLQELKQLAQGHADSGLLANLSKQGLRILLFYLSIPEICLYFGLTYLTSTAIVFLMSQWLV